MGIDDIAIVGNECDVGKVYGQGTYAHSGANPPTHVVRRANNPMSETRTSSGTGGAWDPKYGWVNEWMPEILFNTLVVSQKRGQNTTGIRESDLHPYVTINFAISEAIAGDTVLVKDGVFDQLIEAKDGITVRFMPEATLVCTTADGCILSAADVDNFYFYHEHTPISSAKSGRVAVLIAHDGAYHIHAEITNTGATSAAHAVSVTAANAILYLHGSHRSINNRNGLIYSLSGIGIFQNAANSNVFMNSGMTVVSGGTGAPAISVGAGTIRADDANISSGDDYGVQINTQLGMGTFRRCSIEGAGTGSAAVRIVATATANDPIFRDCVLISEGTATQSISCSAAQDVVIMGTVIGNKGSEPPTNVTFKGGGTYAVDADAVYDV